jgi:hypothetical protein
MPRAITRIGYLITRARRHNSSGPWPRSRWTAPPFKIL